MNDSTPRMQKRGAGKPRKTSNKVRTSAARAALAKIKKHPWRNYSKVGSENVL